MPENPVFARLRAALAAQLRPPLVVTPTGKQYYFDEDSAAYAEIDVQDADSFLVAIVRSSDDERRSAFLVRIWHHRADEVWLVDEPGGTITVVPRDGEPWQYGPGMVLTSLRLPDVRIPIDPLFAPIN